VAQDRGQLARRVTTKGAVMIGLGSMLGAGVFGAVGPAAGEAGTWLLAGLALAGGVAFANATSSAQLAAVYPESGGTYVYARRKLGDYWGFVAGWGFVVGKTASLAAMALTFGFYASPAAARPLAVGAVVVLTFVNYRGIEKTTRLTTVLVVLVLLALGLVVIAALDGHPSFTHLSTAAPGGVIGVFRSAGLLFFAFAGYARIATLGEEVRSPQRTIPRAIPIALGLVLAAYGVVFTTALLALGPRKLAEAPAPLAAVAEAGRWTSIAPVVRAGAAVASLGVLLSLLVGVSRTSLAMSRRGDLPRFLDRVHPVHRTPHRAEIVVAAAVVALVLLADIRGAIGFSSLAVLSYYAVTNASALRLPSAQRRWPRWLALVGLGGCLLLALTLPQESVIGGVTVLAIGSMLWLVRRKRHAKARKSSG
jgi:APA family basic amino acid/polyamine antiporter